MVRPLWLEDAREACSNTQDSRPTPLIALFEISLSYNMDLLD